MTTATATRPPTFAARFPGFCAKGDRIEVGQPIVRNESGKYQHDECAGAERPTLAPADDLTVGMYRKGEAIFKVQESKTSGNLYAKRLVPIGGKRLVDATEEVVGFEFEYEAGAIRGLTLADRLTLEDAKAFGLRFGFCCICALPLKDAASVALGIGPVCRKRFD